MSQNNTERGPNPMTAPPAGALEACLALLEKATPGGWRWSPNGNIVPAHYTDDCEIAAVYSEHMDDVDVPDNAAAIIAAVNLLRTHGPALLAALRLREWRPIESAPKDGARVMLCNAAGVWMAEYRPVYVSGYRPENPWASAMLNCDHMPCDGRYASPTHWMPLPAPPTADDLARVLEESATGGEAGSA